MGASRMVQPGTGVKHEPHSLSPQLKRLGLGLGLGLGTVIGLGLGLGLGSGIVIGFGLRLGFAGRA